MKTLNVLALALLTASGGAFAQAEPQPDPQANHSPSPHAAVTQGEVRKIDREAGKLTLRHGPIENLDMGPMTMVFRVADRAMLDEVKPGDRVTFVADRIDGAITVVRLEPLR